MSANFLDNSGDCAGTDLHTFVTIGPLGAPVPIPFAPHAVGVSHAWASRAWRIAHTVTTTGSPVLQNNWALLLIPHAPMIGAPPHPAEGAMIASIVLGSSIAPQLTAHKVTGEGQPLFTEISGCLGLNVDCSDLPMVSADLNLNTVMTTPTLGDYIGAIVSGALSAFYGMIPGGIPLAMIQNLLDFVNAELGDYWSWAGDPYAIAISNIAAAIQRAVDGEPALGQ